MMQIFESIYSAITGSNWSHAERDLWVDQAIENMHLKPGVKASHVYSRFYLPISKTDYYVALQQKISRLVPRESDRPTIDLFLTERSINTSFLHRPQMTIGVLGGVGPVVDADLADKIYRQIIAEGIDPKDIEINILSAPPPRNFLSAIFHLPRWIDRVNNFFHRQHNYYFLASNTAHVRLKFAQWLGSSKTVDLIGKVVDHISFDHFGKSVIVLGTSVAKKARLYPTALSRSGIHFVETDDKEQKALQKLIIEYKMTPNSNTADKIEGLVRYLVESKVSHGEDYAVLLGCTELPTALGVRGITKLEKDFGVTVINTQEIFSEVIHQHITEKVT